MEKHELKGESLMSIMKENLLKFLRTWLKTADIYWHSYAYTA